MEGRGVPCPRNLSRSLVPDYVMSTLSCRHAVPVAYGMLRLAGLPHMPCRRTVLVGLLGLLVRISTV